MRVLLVHSRYRSQAPSGENLVVDQEAAALRAAGHDVEVFERRSDDLATASVLTKAALPVTSVRNRDTAREITATIGRVRPDVVHVHNTFPLISASVLTAAYEADVPIVATLHNYKLLCASGDFFREGRPCQLCQSGRVAPSLRHACYRGSRLATAPVAVGMTLNRRLWRDLVSAYVFISASQRDLMAALDLPPDRVFVKHNFVSAETSAPGLREHVVTFVGRLDQAKGLPLLMRAWELFGQRHPESALRLVIAGGGPLGDEVGRWARKQPRVQFKGLIGRPDARRLVAGARAAVVPSQWQETFGLVAVEAMAAGVAPVAPDAGSFPELITSGKDGVLFNPGDPGALAVVFEQVDQFPERFAEHGQRALDSYRERFEPGRNLDRLLEIYQYARLHSRSR